MMVRSEDLPWITSGGGWQIDAENLATAAT
jgi:hypothetical protein